MEKNGDQPDAEDGENKGGNEASAHESEERDLTPDEESQLREAVDRIRSALNPTITSALAGIQRSGALDRVLRDMNKWKHLGIGDSILKDALGKGVLSSSFETARLAKLMPPAALEPSWVKQLKLIDSDVFKMSGLGQSNLTVLNSVLAKNADFGFNNTAAKIAAQFAAQQNALLANIGPRLASFKFNIYPPNLQDVAGLRIEKVEAVVMLDGIAVYGVPRKEIAEKLIRATSTAARRDILGRRGKAIVADCRAALEGCSSSSVAAYVSFAVSALDAWDTGNHQAAQALTASVLDTVVNGYFGKQRYSLTPNRKTTTASEYDRFTVREFIAFAPLWQAYQKYKAEDGDPVPRTFSRHASVHGVSSRQFSKRNAVQGLLFVSSLLLFLDEQVARLEAA